MININSINITDNPRVNSNNSNNPNNSKNRSNIDKLRSIESLILTLIYSESASVSNSSIDTQSIDTQSIDTQSIETKSIETKSIDTKSIDTQSIDTKLIETKLIDTKSIDTKSIVKPSYAEIVKRIPTDEQLQYMKTSNLLSKKLKYINLIDFGKRSKILLEKLLKYEKNVMVEKIKYHQMIKKVYDIINKEPSNINNKSMIKTIIQINNIFSEYKIKKFCNLNESNESNDSNDLNDLNDSNDSNDLNDSNNPTYTNKNHKWVSGQLINTIEHYFLSNVDNFDNFNDLNSLAELKIVDIGGGEGDIISLIGESLDIPNENIYCVESRSSWSESYKFNKKINYIFWDNSNIEIEPNSIDVIIIMVSIHHMDNQTIQNLMLNLNKLLKPNGLVIIKEHDSKNLTEKKIIDLEHHLYHIMMTPTDEINEKNLKSYLDNFTNNYMSMDQTEELFKQNGFKHIKTLDRMFNSFNSHNINDITNPTNLYWALYTK
jgi:2-polyprenyl-3-methyl-5-hydroxy-6-metoxy-1,4-benzoquinol methylase